MRVKMKSADYLTLHKMIFGLNARVVWERMGQGEHVNEIMDGLPDEFHQWVKDIAGDLSEQAAQIATEAAKQYRDVFNKVKDIEDPHERRKAFAKSAAAMPMKKYLFMLYDGKDIWDSVWNNIRPSGVETIKVIPEDVA